jgi:hypothetical protein
MAGAVRYQLILRNKVGESASVAYTESTLQEFVLEQAATDSAISMGGVTTAEVMYLKSDQDLALNVNDSAGTDITIYANKPFFMAGTAITSIYLTNSSIDTPANVVLNIWGSDSIPLPG